MASITTDDRARFHELLDYALDNEENYVIMQFAQMDLTFNIHKEIYRLSICKTESNETSTV